MTTNYAEKLIESSLDAVRELLKLEGDRSDGVIVEGNHMWVSLFQSVDSDFDLKALRAIGCDAQRIGMEWAERVMSVRVKENGSRHRYFHFDGRLFNDNKPYVEFTFYLSPLDLVYYMETYEKVKQQEAEQVADGMVRVFTLDGRGLIPVGAKVVFRESRLEMIGSDWVGDMRVHPLTVNLMSESMKKLERRSSVTAWELKDDHGGVLFLAPDG